MSLVEKIYRGVGLVSGWSGRVASFLVVILVISITYDVFMRYALNAPTTWSYPLSYMLGGCVVVLGMPYVYYRNANVRIDVIYSRLPPKTKLALDICLSFLVFFPTVFVLVTIFGEDAWHAYVIKEVAIETIWYPILWPFKTLMALGLGLLFLQGITTLIKDIVSLTKGGTESW